MIKAGKNSTEFAAAGLVGLFAAVHDKVGIDWMQPEAMSALTWITVAYITGRSAVKVASALANPKTEVEE